MSEKLKRVRIKKETHEGRGTNMEEPVRNE
jgi:hypothetical protein